MPLRLRPLPPSAGLDPSWIWTRRRLMQSSTTILLGRHRPEHSRIRSKNPLLLYNTVAQDTQLQLLAQSLCSHDSLLICCCYYLPFAVLCFSRGLNRSDAPFAAAQLLAPSRHEPSASLHAHHCIQDGPLHPLLHLTRITLFFLIFPFKIHSLIQPLFSHLVLPHYASVLVVTMTPRPSLSCLNINFKT